MIVATIALIFFNSLGKLKQYKEKMDNAETIIDENLNKKLDLIIAANGDVKKVTGKKDYLKEYISLRDFIITNMEKDLKLTEAYKLIIDLTNDFNELRKDENFVKNIEELKRIDEILTSAKNIYNQNAINSNKLIKVFPNNIIAKISKIKIRCYYDNKTDSEETF